LGDFARGSSLGQEIMERGMIAYVIGMIMAIVLTIVGIYLGVNWAVPNDPYGNGHRGSSILKNTLGLALSVRRNLEEIDRRGALMNQEPPNVTGVKSVLDIAGETERRIPSGGVVFEHLADLILVGLVALERNTCHFLRTTKPGKCSPGKTPRLFKSEHSTCAAGAR
jgi:hypothetical protein